MLDQFRALSAGDDDGRRNGRSIRLRDGVGALIVATVGKRRIDLAKNLNGPLSVAADDDAIGEKEVGDGGSFPQKFRVGSHVKQFWVCAVAKNDLAHPFAGVDRDGTLLDD